MDKRGARRLGPARPSGAAALAASTGSSPSATLVCLAGLMTGEIVLRHILPLLSASLLGPSNVLIISGGHFSGRVLNRPKVGSAFWLGPEFVARLNWVVWASLTCSASDMRCA